MEKIVEIHKSGIVIVDMGFGEKSVEARNFLAQIANLVAYDGPNCKYIVFTINEDSIKQAAEWGINRKDCLGKIFQFSRQSGIKSFAKNFYYKIWQKTKFKQKPGIYSCWIKCRCFWTKNRLVQFLWVLRSFNKPINYASLPRGMWDSMDRHFESWFNYVKFSGFTPEEEAFSIRKNKWNKKVVIAKLKALKASGIPIHTGSLIKHNQRDLHRAIIRYFGNWTEAVKASGFDPEKEWQGKIKRYSPEKIVEIILKRKSNGDQITQAAIMRADRLLIYSAIDHFGTWNNALSAANIDPLTISGLKWSRELVISTLKELKDSGESISHWQLAHNHRKLYGGLRRHFNSWADAVGAAGFDPIKESKRPASLKNSNKEEETQ